MGVMLATLGVGTLYAIYLLGMDRGRAIQARVSLEQLLEGHSETSDLSFPPVDTTRSFVAVGILLALAGAIAFGVATVELRHALGRSYLRARIAILRRRLRRATGRLFGAAADAQIAKRHWEQDEARAVRQSNLEIVDALLAAQMPIRWSEGDAVTH
jgi:hypothetical protein